MLAIKKKKNEKKLIGALDNEKLSCVDKTLRHDEHHLSCMFQNGYAMVDYNQFSCVLGF